MRVANLRKATNSLLRLMEEGDRLVGESFQECARRMTFSSPVIQLRGSSRSSRELPRLDRIDTSTSELSQCVGSAPPRSYDVPVDATSPVQPREAWGALGNLSEPVVCQG